MIGLADCVLALGFEKMERGSLSAKVSNNLLLYSIKRRWAKSPKQVKMCL